MASSALEAGPPSASVLNRPRRSPSAAIIVANVALESLSTLPTNACTLSESMVADAVVMHNLLQAPIGPPRPQSHRHRRTRRLNLEHGAGDRAGRSYGRQADRAHAGAVW